MKRRVIVLLSALLFAPILLLSSEVQQAGAAADMPMMADTMTVGECSSACNGRDQPAVAYLDSREVEADTDNEPEPPPAEPYYLQFFPLYFAPAAATKPHTAAYLLWQPPDIYKLNASYRF